MLRKQKKEKLVRQGGEWGQDGREWKEEKCERKLEWSERRKEKEREESSGSERELNDRFFIVVLGTSERKSNKKIVRMERQNM